MTTINLDDERIAHLHHCIEFQELYARDYDSIGAHDTARQARDRAEQMRGKIAVIEGFRMPEWPGVAA